MWALSILAPLSYIGFLVTSLWLFSKIYRRRQAAKPETEPWFPPHKSRDIYVSLLSLDPPPPRPILVAALLRRAMDDVKLIWSIRDAKTSLTTLLQRGQIGDELWERFLLAEKELEAEIVEVVGEANTFEPGYGQRIFGHASDMVSHERWKEIYRDIPKARAEEQQRMNSQAPNARVLAPTTYLTPSSLTLAPSNPLPAAGSSPAPGPALMPSPAKAPLSASDTTSAPPSRGTTPLPESPATPAKQVNGAAAKPASPAGAAASPAPGSPAPAVSTAANGATTSEGDASAAESSELPPPVPPASDKTPVSTPKKTPNSKKGKKKPQVKGGR
ncbi:Translocation protein S66 [Rhodotorula sphaerocarpa]